MVCVGTAEAVGDSAGEKPAAAIVGTDANPPALPLREANR